MIADPERLATAEALDRPDMAEAPSGAVNGTWPAALGLIAADGAAVAAVVWLASTAFEGLAGAGFPELLMFAGVTEIGLKAGHRLYPGFGAHPEARVRKAGLAIAGAGLIATAAGIILTGAAPIAIALLWGALVLLGLLQGVGSRLVRVALGSVGLWAVPVQIIGDPAAIERLTQVLRADPGFGYLPARGATGSGTVIWAARCLPDPSHIAWLRQSGQEVILASDMAKLPLSGVHPAQHGGDLGLRLSSTAQPGSGGLLKRCIDLCFAIPLSIVAAPIVLIAAACIRLVDRGSAFYVQKREGRGGETFGVLKLRTMYLDADRQLADLLERDAEARAEWAEHFKLRRDPRILPYIGRFLRSSSLDELPQLWNVLRGEMSLVGPRPFPHYHLEAMPPEFRARRATVVPGLTGLWQISERSTADLAAQEMLDDFYIAGRTFWVDLSILLRTFSALVGRHGAY